MTCYDFYMNVKMETVRIDCKDGDMMMTAEILFDDFIDTLLHCNSNLEYIAEPLKEELFHRAEGVNDLGKISDDELNIFKTVAGMIL